MKDLGAFLRNRAARALHRAALRLDHPASIPCADIFERPIAVGLIRSNSEPPRLEVYIQWANGALDRVINSHAVTEHVNHWAAVFPRLTASAIEARSGETTKIGSTEGESATRQGDAQNPSSGNHQ